MRKRIILILVLMLILMSLPVFADSVTLNLNGVPSNWAKSDLSLLAKYGVLEQRIFKTYQESITRLDFIYLAVKLYEEATGVKIVIDPKINFLDTNDTYVLKGTTVGITSGIGEGKFGPNVKITREQLSTMMVKTLELAGKKFTESSFRFTDDQQISSYAKASIYKAYNHKIISGFNNAVNPKGNATIEQALLIFKSSYDSFTKTLLSPSQVAEIAGKAVVHIKTFDKSGQPLGTGSGFIVEESGKVVTNFHVISGAYSAVVKTISGTEYPAQYVLGYDIQRDVAVLKINGNQLPTLPLGNSDSIVQGEEILTIGSPIGLENTISNGLISSKKRILEGNNYIQISAPISHGSSGGALLNYFGDVIGITSAGFENGQNLNLAIPINEVKTLLSVTKQISLADLATLKTIGTITFDNGDTYNGEMQLGRMHGNGTYSWASGGYYTGGFYEDLYHGQGIMYLEDGTFIKGVWENDIFSENLMVPTIYARAFSATDIEIGWQRIENADHYYVYYSEEPDVKWYYFKDAIGNGLPIDHVGEYSAELNNNTPGATVYFAVSSVVLDVESKPSQIVSVTLPQSPTVNITGPLYLYSDEYKPVYLGKLTTNKYDLEGIFNKYGNYGSAYASKSIFNNYGSYGGKYSTYSAFNNYTSTPPLIIDGNGDIVGRLTTNQFVEGAVSPYEIFSVLESLGF